jgi:hypothetical protein
MTRLLVVLCTSLLTIIGFSLAQAEEPAAITLSCDGTTRAYLKSEVSINPVTKMVVVINPAERTVSFDGHVAHIDHIDAAVIYFGGNNVTDATGYIDGKIGVMTATNTDGHRYSELYELVCPAATGAFSGLHEIAAADSGERAAPAHAAHSRNKRSHHAQTGAH